MPIIPNIKGGSGGGGDVTIKIDGATDHEKLGSLYGGDADGHWHLTREEYEKLKRILEGDIPEPPKPEINEYDGGYPWTSDDEYNANRDNWLDGGYPPNDHEKVVDGGREVLSLYDGDSESGDLDGGEI